MQNAVDSLHPKYQSMIADWEKCRCVFDGETSVKAKGSVFLPALSGMTSTEYEAYKTRAEFFNATRRTVQTLVGALKSKPASIQFPTTNTPDEEDNILKDIGCASESVEQIAYYVTEQLLAIGRIGIYVDASNESENAQPYIALYQAEDIINWRTEEIDGRDELVLVVLHEPTEVVDSEDSFKSRCVNRYRVLTLKPEGDDYSYYVSVYEKSKKKDSSGRETESWIEVMPEVSPKMFGGRGMNRIPFLIVNPNTIGVEVENPPMLDLVNTNLSHYRTSADLEHGQHFTALPTAWIAGVDTKAMTFKIGSSAAWVFESPDAKAGYLEFSGAGLSRLSESMREKENRMVALGAKMLESEKADAEAAQTFRMRQANSHSSLQSISVIAGEAMTKALILIAGWMGLPTDESIKFLFPSDLTVYSMDAQTLSALMAAQTSGVISYATLFHNMKRGGIIPSERTEESEKELIVLDQANRLGSFSDGEPLVLGDDGGESDQD